MSGKTCSKCYYLLVAARRHKVCTSLSSSAEACKDFREVSVFDKIVTSPELLAEEFVEPYTTWGADGYLDKRWKTSFRDLSGRTFDTRAEAVAATIEKLKEVAE